MKPAGRSRHDLPAGKTRSRLSLTLPDSRSLISKDESSNPVASMPQTRLQLLREAFNLIDQDGDGIIDKDDLISTYENFGTKISDKEAKEMLFQAKGPLNYTKFACMLAARTGDLDDSDILLNAFAILDEDQDGKIQIQELCKKLMTIGYERMSIDEVTAMAKAAPVDINGKLDYRKFVNIIEGVFHH